MAKILVTGGAGFVGSHLCDYLLGKGHKIICLDNLFTGSKENVKRLLKNKNFEFVIHDIVEPFYTKKKIDEIYNLACPASPVHYQFNPVHTVKASTLGVINMLGLARKHKALILQASTSEVYGDPEVHPQNEKYRGCVNPIGPRACYDEGKRCAETLFFDYHRMHKMPVKIVRIFNTYGPRMAFNDGRVVSNFILQALKNKEITVYGNGEQTRSFQYISDLVSGMVKMMEKKNFTGPVNLGNPDEFSVKELAEMVIKMTGSSSKIVYKPLPADDPKRRQPDIALAKKELNWRPEIKIEEGFSKTIDYFKQALKK